MSSVCKDASGRLPLPHPRYWVAGPLARLARSATCRHHAPPEPCSPGATRHDSRPITTPLKGTSHPVSSFVNRETLRSGKSIPAATLFRATTCRLTPTRPTATHDKPGRKRVSLSLRTGDENPWTPTVGTVYPVYPVTTVRMIPAVLAGAGSKRPPYCC